MLLLPLSSLLPVGVSTVLLQQVCSVGVDGDHHSALPQVKNISENSPFSRRASGLPMGVRTLRNYKMLCFSILLRNISFFLRVLVFVHLLIFFFLMCYYPSWMVFVDSLLIPFLSSPFFLMFSGFVREDGIYED